jgi:hypothetical protein
MYYFIGGFPRTGTTLVQNILCGAPNVNPITAEICYVEYMIFAYNRLLQGWESNKEGLFQNKAEYAEVQTAALEVFFTHLKKKHGVETLIMKRPFMTRYFPILAKWYPESHYIICVRDPRDVMGSLKRVQRLHLKTDLKRQRANPWLDQSMADYCYGYTHGVAECLEKGREFPGRFHFVKYEDLVKNPDTYISELGKLLGLELGEQMAWKDEGWIDNNPFHSDGWGKKITADNVGLYKSQLYDEELDIIEEMCAPIMEVFDYE